MTEHNKEKNEEQDKVFPLFQYTLDDEPQSTSEHVLTARQILLNSGLNAESYYLVQIIGREEKAYKDKPDENIHMHQNLKFISVFVGETPVSESIWG